MPYTTLPLDHVFATITRSVAKSSLTQLAYFTDMQVGRIIFNERGESSKPNTANRTNSGQMDTPLELESSNVLTCRYEEVFKEDSRDPTVNTNDQPPIFDAPELGINVRPTVAKTTLRITCKLRSRSYNTMATWLSKFRMETMKRVATNTHDLNYTYTLPDELCAYLFDVHTMTQKIAPTGVNLKDWTNERYTNGLFVRSNSNDTVNKLAINVNLKGALGIFSGIPDAIETNKEKGISQVEFTYEITYDKPTLLDIEYQKFIHNQTIDPVFINLWARTPELSTPAEITHLSNQFAGFKYPVQYVGYNDIFFDMEDRFLPKPHRGDYSTILVAPMQIVEADLRDVINLNDLSDAVGITPDLLSELSRFSECLHIPNQTPFTVELHEVGTRKVIKQITIDSDLNLRSVEDCDLTKRYYVHITVLTDLGKLPGTVLEEYQTHPNEFVYLISLLNPEIVQVTENLADNIVTLGNGTFLPVSEMIAQFKKLKNTNKKYNTFSGTQRLYVMNINLLTGAK